MHHYRSTSRRKTMGKGQGRWPKLQNERLKAELRTTIIDALQNHLGKHELESTMRSPQGNADVQVVLRKACVARLEELECPSNAAEYPAELLEGLRSFIRAMDATPCKLEGIVGVKPAQQHYIPTVMPANRRCRVPSAAAIDRGAKKQFEALNNRLLEFNEFMRRPENSLETDCKYEDTGSNAEVLQEVPDHPLDRHVDGLDLSDVDTLDKSTCKEFDASARIMHLARFDVAVSQCASSTDQGNKHLLSPGSRVPERSFAKRAAQFGVGSMSAAARDQLLAELRAGDNSIFNSLK